MPYFENVYKKLQFINILDNKANKKNAVCGILIKFAAKNKNSI